MKSRLMQASVVFVFLVSVFAFVKNGEAVQLNSEKDGLILSVLEKNASFDKFGKKDAVYAHCFQEYVINESGSVDYTTHNIIKIFNANGFDSTTQSVKFDKQHSTLKQLFARIIKTDGTYSEVNFKEKPQFIGLKPLSNLVEKTPILPDIKSGDYLEVFASAHLDNAVFPGLYSNDLQLAQRYPAKNCQLHVRFPKQLNLRYKLQNKNGNIKLKSNSGSGDWWFEIDNFNGVKIEKGGPIIAEVVPTVLVSNISDFDVLSRWQTNHLTGDHYKINKKMQKVIDLLAKKANGNDEALAAAVYRWVVDKNVLYQGSKLKVGGVPQTAANTFRNGYLDCRDKTTLLVAMYRALNFEAYETWINTRNATELQIDFPMLLFDHSIVVLKIDNKFLFLDPVCKYCNYGELPYFDQGRHTLVIYLDGKSTITKTPYMSPERNESVKTYDITLNENGSSAEEVSYVFTGENASKWRRLGELSPKQLKKYIKNNYVGEGKKLIQHKIRGLSSLTSPIEIYIKMQDDEFGYREGNVYTKGDPGQYLIDDKFIMEKRRLHDLDMGPLETKRTIYKFKASKNFKIDRLPVMTDIDNKYFSLKRTVKHFPKSNEMFFEEIYKRKINMISKSEYRNFKEAYEKLIKKSINQQWIVTKN